MGLFIIHSQTGGFPTGLSFSDDGGRLTVTGSGEGVPDAVVPAFDPARDVWYAAPEALTADELSEEIQLHIPQPLLDQLECRPSGGTAGKLVLLQMATVPAPVISPLSALTSLLDAGGPVNSAILQADNGGLVFIRRAGNEWTAHASPLGISTFFELDTKGRHSVFPDFDASELLLSGSDLDDWSVTAPDPIVIERHIDVQDFFPLVDFSEEALLIVSERPHRYALVIGGAIVYSSIRQAALEAVRSGGTEAAR